MTRRQKRRGKKLEEDKDLQNSGTQEADAGEITTKGEEKAPESESQPVKPAFEKELEEHKDKYLRLYAEFENYRKRVQKDKEELVRYGNESLLYDLMPVIDNLEMAIQHSSDDVSIGDQPRLTGLVQGVEITLKEFLRVLDRFGLTQITALGKTFDPALHHAMTQVERDDVDENTVVEEFRKGYMYRDRVLRPSLVAVSKKAVNSEQLSSLGPHSGGFTGENEATVVSQEEEEKVNTNENIEEER